MFLIAAGCIEIWEKVDLWSLQNRHAMGGQTEWLMRRTIDGIAMLNPMVSRASTVPFVPLLRACLVNFSALCFIMSQYQLAQHQALVRLHWPPVFKFYLLLRSNSSSFLYSLFPLIVETAVIRCNTRLQCLWFSPPNFKLLLLHCPLVYWSASWVLPNQTRRRELLWRRVRHAVRGQSPRRVRDFSMSNQRDV